MSGGGINPVLALVSRTDSLADEFRKAHAASVPLIGTLEGVYAQAASQGGWASETEQHAEGVFSSVRDLLQHMERVVEEMMNLVYQIGVHLNDMAVPPTAAFNPKEALDHVSAAVDSYQAELLSKRELLSDLTCEEISIQDFSSKWRRLDEIEAGKQQDLDSLADMFAGFG